MFRRCLYIILFLIPALVCAQPSDPLTLQVIGLRSGLFTDQVQTDIPNDGALALEEYLWTLHGYLIPRNGFIRHNKDSDSTSTNPIDALVGHYDGLDKALYALRDDPGDAFDEFYSITEVSGDQSGPRIVPYVFRGFPNYPALGFSWNSAANQNYTFFANTKEELWAYAADDITAFSVRVAGPGQPFTTLLNTVGSQGTGPYRYAYAYKTNSVTYDDGVTQLSSLVISDLSIPSWPIFPDGRAIRIWNIIARSSGVAAADSIILYRTKSGDSVFYRIPQAVAPTSVVIDDALSDAALGAATTFRFGDGDHYRAGDDWGGTIDTSLIKMNGQRDFIYPPGAPICSLEEFSANALEQFSPWPDSGYNAYVNTYLVYVDSFGNHSFPSPPAGVNGDTAVYTISTAARGRAIRVFGLQVPSTYQRVQYALLLRQVQPEGELGFPDNIEIPMAVAGTRDSVNNAGYAIEKEGASIFVIDTIDQADIGAYSRINLVDYDSMLQLPIYKSFVHREFFNDLLGDSISDSSTFHQLYFEPRPGQRFPDSIVRIDSSIYFRPGDIAFHGERLFAIGDEQNPNVMFYSEQTGAGLVGPMRWPATHFLSFGRGDGDRLVSIIKTEKGLYLFKNDEVISFTGFRFIDFGAARVFDKIGATAPKSVDSWNNTVVFAHESGIYAIRPNDKPRIISAQIQEIFDSLSYETLRAGIGGFVDKDYWFSYSTDTSLNYNNRTLVWVQRMQAWTQFNRGFQSLIKFNSQKARGESHQQRYLFGGRNDKLYEYEYSDSVHYDNKGAGGVGDSTIIAKFQTKYFFEELSGKKRIMYFDIIGDGTIDSMQLVIRRDLRVSNFTLVDTQNVVIDFTEVEGTRVKFEDLIVNNVSFEISDYGLGSHILKGFEIGYKIVGDIK